MSETRNTHGAVAQKRRSFLGKCQILRFLLDSVDVTEIHLLCDDGDCNFHSFLGPYFRRRKPNDVLTLNHYIVSGIDVIITILAF